LALLPAELKIVYHCVRRRNFRYKYPSNPGQFRFVSNFSARLTPALALALAVHDNTMVGQNVHLDWDDFGAPLKKNARRRQKNARLGKTYLTKTGKPYNTL
jgi:hypothetical protein